MLSKHNHRIYALPTVLFLFLTFLFVSAGVFIQNDERAARISKAQSVAEQVKISLEVFSSERIQALHKIAKRMQSTSVPAEKICFEITETTAVTNLSAAKHFISTLRDLGCSFALDDFGAGMSSFTYLKNLDVDYVKIDGSFVRNIVHDPIDHATVTAINNIAHSMGKQTVAEFVVDNATAEVLRELKVDFGQGFALDKPKPLAHRVQWRVKLASA